MRHILLGITSGLAATKAHKLAVALKAIGDVKTVATNDSCLFLSDWPSTREMPFPVFSEGDWHDPGSRPPHQTLSEWASVLVIAPLDANTLARMASGFADNILTKIVRSWDWSKPMVLVPMMDEAAWINDPTKHQLNIMRTRGAQFPEGVYSPFHSEFRPKPLLDLEIATIVDKVSLSMRWLFPISGCPGIPINHHPGAFGFHRQKNHHTGVDLYCHDGTEVRAVESGVVVKIDYFTGPMLGHTWWEPTMAVMVEGPSGVVNYGEITPDIYLGQRIKQGQLIGRVKRVLFPDKHRPDIPGHSTSMLHLELYKPGTREFADWHDVSKNPDLLDPTQLLIEARDGPSKTLTWDNEEKKTVG